jgi:glycosyltransferase involved in cell wall biosynthesis
MRAGLPVIHSDDPALMEVAGAAGIVVRRNTLSDDLRRAISDATSMSPAEREAYAQRGTEVSNRFDWSRASLKTQALLETFEP